MIRAALAITLALLASACMTIGAFNERTPHDAGVVRVAHDVAYGAGPRRTLDVYAPQQRGTRAPVIVFFYGGGWSEGAKQDYSFAGEAFAARGYELTTLCTIRDFGIEPTKG